MITKKENVSRETFSFFVCAPGGTRLRNPFLTVHVQHRPVKCKEIKSRSTSGSCGEAEQASLVEGETWSWGLGCTR